MAKIVQIAANDNALYALDDRGNIYQTLTGADWTKLPSPPVAGGEIKPKK